MKNSSSEYKFQNKITVYKKEPSFGKGPAQIMELVQKTNSLSKAYNIMGLSSSKGWKIIKKAEEDLGFELFHTVVGGKDGGYSTLSTEGEEFLKKYQAFRDELHKKSEEIFKKHFPD